MLPPVRRGGGVRRSRVLRHRVRRAASTALLLLVAVAPSVTAADAPAGVVFDGTVTATWIDIDTGPVDGAEVLLTASQKDVAIHSAAVTTTGDGVAVFTGVPRAESGEPVTLDLVGLKEVRFSDDVTHCSGARTWHAEAHDVAIAAEPVAVTFTLIGGASSVECPDGQLVQNVVADGEVTVVVREPVADGVTPGDPIAGANVELVVYQTDFDEPIQLLTGTSDAAGVVSFAGVLREEGVGPTVHLAVSAYREIVTTDDRDCTTVESWYGFVADLPAESAQTVEIETEATSSIECTAGVPLEGRILDREGQPLEIELATVSVVVPPAGGAQSFPLEVADDGSFGLSLPAVGTFDQPAIVTVEIRSSRTREEVFDQVCQRFYAQQGSWTGDVALEEGETIPFIEIVSDEIVVGEECGAVSATPTPHTGAPEPRPALTLPPTDARMTGDSGTTPVAALGVVGVVLVTVGGLAAGTRRRRA